MKKQIKSILQVYTYFDDVQKTTICTVSESFF